MKNSIAIISFMVATCCSVRSEFIVLMYTDSRFEDYVGQVHFDSTDRCYPLCTESEAVAAFAWDGEPQGTQLAIFEDVECQGRSAIGDKKTGAEFSAIAAGHKVRSFFLSTTGTLTPTRGTVHSCKEKSDMVYKPFNDSATWK